MAERFILALDQGTTGSAAIVFDQRGTPVSSADQEITQIYPRPGWVSHDANQIWDTTIAQARAALDAASIGAEGVAAIGITNQRETTVIWDRATGEPIAPAIVWQCRRTAPLCRQLVQDGLESLVRERTGLVIDAYFSGTKVRWLLDNVPGARGRAARGELAFGTIDSWLLWRLTDGAVHATDYSNASRTMLFDIHRGEWDDDLLRALDVPASLLPSVKPSSGLFGELRGPAREALGRRAIPISGVAGDQQAALFGQACFSTGMAKNTYGTGSFTLLQTGERAVRSENGLLTTIAWGLDSKIHYALEGGVFITGAAVQWLRDGLRIIDSAAETEQMATSVGDTGGVYFVPAFAGLGAPHWDMDARGTIVGITGGTRREHLVRATLESIAYQTADVLNAMTAEAHLEIPILRVDGGGTANAFLMQFQADLLGIPIEVAAVQETTARGAAYLAGLGVGFWPDQSAIDQLWQPSRRFEPTIAADSRRGLSLGWSRAVDRARGWATHAS